VRTDLDPVRQVMSLGGLGLILAGVFEVERPAVPDTIEETIHSDATLTAFTLIITAMLLFAVACRRDPRWSDFRVIAAVLAIIAAVAGACSPFAGQTTWSGLAQRVQGRPVVIRASKIPRATGGRAERPTAPGRPRLSAVECCRLGAAPRRACGSQPRESSPQ
jgi:hypothetical protein